MFKEEIPAINESLKKTRRAVICFGCSFAEGQGAVPFEIYQNYAPPQQDFTMVSWNDMPYEHKKEIADKYGAELCPYGPSKDNVFINMAPIERQNNYSGILCREFLDGWTHINFGMRGNGNRASINNLWHYPDLRLDLIDEVIVIYTPAGMDRFDFARKDLPDTGHFTHTTMWPHKDAQPEEDPRKPLWDSYAEYLYSPRMVIQEQIYNIHYLMSWMKNIKKHHFIMTPAYDRAYDRGVWLAKWYIEQEMVDMFPWEAHFRPGGHHTFIEYVEATEGLPLLGYWGLNGKGSPKGYITPCSHPGVEGHRVFAKAIYEKLRNEQRI